VQPKGKTPKASRSVLEITSDNDSAEWSGIHASSAAGGSFKKKVVEAEKEIARMKEENRVLKAKIEDLSACRSHRKSSSPSKVTDTAPSGSAVISLDDLDELVSCQVCMLKMWTPYLLPDCGHAFCQSCLVDWFDTTLTQFTASHPHYNPNTAHNPNPLRPTATHSYASLPPEVVNFLREPQISYNPVPALSMTAHQILARHRLDITRQRQGWGGHGGNTGGNGGGAGAEKPEYTCPFCRLALRSRPIEDFRLKEIVKKLSEAAGEKEKPLKGSAALRNPFVTYFP